MDLELESQLKSIRSLSLDELKITHPLRTHRYRLQKQDPKVEAQLGYWCARFCKGPESVSNVPFWLQPRSPQKIVRASEVSEPTR